ncbi:hypothetical protein AAG570_002243, partial [Ranatra chinensis]
DEAVFRQAIDESFSPNAVLLDLEPTVIDAVTSGRNRTLWEPCQKVCGKEDAANNFARGRYGVGAALMGEAAEAISGAVEELDNLQGFLAFHSYGGGTGSGFESALVATLRAQYPKAEIVDVAIFPSEHFNTSPLEAYNSVFAAHSTMEAGLCTILADNESLFATCTEQLKLDAPSYPQLNALLSQAVASLTVGLRFDGPQKIDLRDLRMNLVPFPRIHFCLIGQAPLGGSKARRNFTRDITRRCVKSMNIRGKYIAACLLYRGDNSPCAASDTVADLKSRRVLEFVDWSPAGVKFGFDTHRPTLVPRGVIPGLGSEPRSVTAVANATDARIAWGRVKHEFDLMFSKRAFVHWFLTEGMEESEFLEAAKDLEHLEKEYEELEAVKM